jgi:hypothetical protein
MQQGKLPHMIKQGCLQIHSLAIMLHIARATLKEGFQHCNVVVGLRSICTMCATYF